MKAAHRCIIELRNAVFTLRVFPQQPEKKGICVLALNYEKK